MLLKSKMNNHSLSTFITNANQYNLVNLMDLTIQMRALSLTVLFYIITRKYV